MKTLLSTFPSLFAMLCLLATADSIAQKANTSYAVTQQDARLQVAVYYQVDNDAFGSLSQDYRITVQNNTNDKLHVYIEYYADLVCGTRRTSQFAPLGDGYIMQPGEFVNSTWDGTKQFGYQRLLGDLCPKDDWRQTGTDKNGSKTYNLITGLGYRIVKIVNLSEQERKEAETRKLKEEEKKRRKVEEAEKRKKAEEAKIAKETEQTESQTSDQKTTDDLWSDNSNNSNRESTTNTDRDGDLYGKDENFVADSKFKDNLSDVKDGDYFTDDAGGYYQRTSGGARRVDKLAYEKQAANEIYAQIEHRQAEQKQRDAEFKQKWENISTSFYAMSSARQGMRDASDLSGHFETIEELNMAFSQKINEISNMGEELHRAYAQGVQAYSNALSSPSSGYDYSGAVTAIGSIASSIAANKAENDAREELIRQRQEQEAAINERQLKILISIREEISKVFVEGGMPLSSHKVNAPVLYVFAYSGNKTDWNKNQNVSMTVSNVIPVYQYSDGTYPYTSNVKRTFENTGINTPILIGYFTNKDEAETYRNSLLEIAPNAKFVINDVEIKVKEQAVTSNSTVLSDTDFWGNKKTDTKTQNNNKQTETDFWGTGVKGNKAEPKKEVKTKQRDFWND